MAQRRMTSLEVINTDAFLDMPQSSQLLYFHLNARADDDGFVSNPKSIMRNCGSQGDDLKLLIAKKFIITFEDGVCVIKHWRINNYIRKDIYNETKYLNHKQTLFIRPNGAYTLTDDGRAVPVPRGHFQLENIKPKSLKSGSTKGKNNVHDTDTERALSIGKDRLGKDSKEKDNTSEQSSLIPEVIKSFEEINLNCKNFYGNKTQRSACQFLLDAYGFEKVRQVIELLKKTNGMEFMPTITTPVQLKEKWSALETAVKRKQSEIKNKKANIVW